MNTPHAFHPIARLLHWTMAILILAMLFVGVGMVTTVSSKHQWLLAVHRPLGVTVLILAIFRLSVRLRFKPPTLPTDMPVWQQFIARASHWVLYGLMLAIPLVGWSMLSAGGYPIMLGSVWHLPPILPANGELFAWLRLTHRYLAYLLFLAVLGHLGAALYHALIRRDNVFPSMTFASSKRGAPPVLSDAPNIEEGATSIAPPAMLASGAIENVKHVLDDGPPSGRDSGPENSGAK